MKTFRPRPALCRALVPLASVGVAVVGVTLAGPAEPSPAGPVSPVPPPAASSSSSPAHLSLAGATPPNGLGMVPGAGPLGGATSFEPEVEALRRRVLQAGVPPAPIVFYGSSSIRLWKSLKQDFSSYRVLNLGFGGSGLSDCVRYAPELVLPLHPAGVVLYVGDNDLAAGVPPEKAFATFQQLYGLLRSYSRTMPLAYLSVKPSPGRMKFFRNVQRFNELVQQFLRKEPNSEYLDITSDLLGPDKQPIPTLFAEDRIHLSAAGYAVLRREVDEFLREEFPPRPTPLPLPATGGNPPLAPAFPGPAPTPTPPSS